MMRQTMTRNHMIDTADVRRAADLRRVTRVLGFTTLVIFLTFFGAAVGGCGKKSKEKAEKARAAEAEPTTLTIKGSDTMLPMITALAEAYVKVHPDTQISVMGGGSTVGINAFLDGNIDLCMSSRELSTEESAKANFRRIAPQDVVVALDGVTVIVHPENPVNELTLGELRQIFNGKIKNWSEVGGPNQAIQVISQNSDSGTSAFFRERVLQNEDYKSGIQLATSNAAVVQSVARELWSIGYIGFAYAQGASVKMIGIKKNSASPAILPSLATLRDGSYPMERPLHIYASGKVNSLAVSFLEFVLSPEGQRIAREKGYVP
jgi:phosphate transport system substrate-binding protein